jgi:hypothetical protein
MFEVIPQPEFESWYETLPAELAEAVATAIDVAAGSSSVFLSERLSPLLLWFDGVDESSASALGQHLSALHARAYLGWHRDVLDCLDSSAFASRLAQLDPVRAALVLTQVEKLKRQLQATRTVASYAAWPVAKGTTSAPASVREACVDLLRSIGLDAGELLGSRSGLRELTVDTTTPGLRVLFGLDAARRRLIALFGERLDRRYYGDSVKLAEQRWRSYCQAELGATP